MARRSQHHFPKSLFISLHSREPNHFTSPSARLVHLCRPVKVLGRASSSSHQCPTQLARCWRDVPQALPSTPAEQVPLPLPQNKRRTVPATIFSLAWACSRRTHLLFLSAHPDFVTVTNAFSGWEKV